MLAYSGGTDVGAIVAEVGHYTTKMGFAGEDYPRALFRSQVAAQRDSSNKIHKLRHDYMHHPLDVKSGTDGDWETANPIDPSTGLVYYSSNANPSAEDSPSGGSSKSGEDDCFELWMSQLRHGYETGLMGANVKEHPLLLVEQPMTPAPLRQHLVELLFEEMEVPATFLARNAVTACFACGRTTGTVVDIGHSGTTVTPVHEGYVEARGILQSPMGGHAMDQAVLANLDALYKQAKNDNSAQVMPLYQVLAKGQKRKSIFHELARLDMARVCKEDGAGAAISPIEGSVGQDTGVSGGTMVTGGSAAYANAPKVSYELPDETVVEISHPDRFKVANLLFGLDDESVRAREDAVAAHADSLSSLLLSTTPTSSSDSGEKSNTTATTTTTTASQSRLLRRSRAATTGIGKGKRGGGGQRPPFSHDRLKQACLGYLQPAVQGAVGGPAPTTGGTTIATAAAPTVASAIPNMVCDAAFRCDRDQQALLLGNVVLAGGGSCVSPDLPLLLRNNVEQIIHTHTPGWRVKVLAPAIPERAVCSWLGGSIQASLGSFHEMYISKAEYEEWGCGIVNRKCP
eukprot:scaffold158174_cov53-Attheya_sp.AAC.2